MFYFKNNTETIASIEGPDAKDFLNRISSVDFKNLGSNEWTEGFLLQPTGKIQCVFSVSLVAKDLYFFTSPQGYEAFFKSFDKFHFGEKLKITNLKDSYDFYEFFSDEKIISAEAQYSAVRLHSYKSQGTDFSMPPTQWISFTEKNHALKFQGALKEPKAIETLCGIAHWGTTMKEDTMPLEVGLDYGVSEQKGCYPGQEVIERIRSMGAAPRKLVFMELEKNLTVPSPILLKDGTEVGLLTETAMFQNKTYGLGLLKKAFIQHINTEDFYVSETRVTLKVKETL